MATESSLTVRSETDEKNVYTVAIYGRNMLYSTIPINFDNNIITAVTKHPHVVTQWIEGVKADGTTGHRHVGFEVELDFSRKRIGTVQFYVKNRCLVFQLGEPQPQPQPCLPSLEQFLCDHNNFTFVGTQVLWKVEALRRQLSFTVSSPIRVNDLSLYDLELCTKKMILLGSVALPGVLRNLDWARTSNLSHVQVHFACLDAFLNLHIANCLSIL